MKRVNFVVTYHYAKLIDVLHNLKVLLYATLMIHLYFSVFSLSNFKILIMNHLFKLSQLKCLIRTSEILCINEYYWNRVSICKELPCNSFI